MSKEKYITNLLKETGKTIFKTVNTSIGSSLKMSDADKITVAN
jgi:hypothetical protein